MGVDEPPDPTARTSPRTQVRRLLRRCSAWDFDLSTNRYSTEVWHRAYPVDFTTLEYGYPRNDVLVTATGIRVTVPVTGSRHGESDVRYHWPLATSEACSSNWRGFPVRTTVV